jgi:hypothetical protein
MSFSPSPHVSENPQLVRTAAIQKPHLVANWVAAARFSGGIMDHQESEKISRRSFLNRSAAAWGATTVASTAISYSRILGVNDRILLGHIGIRNRGRELDWIVA